MEVGKVSDAAFSAVAACLRPMLIAVVPKLLQTDNGGAVGSMSGAACKLPLLAEAAWRGLRGARQIVVM